MYFYNIFFIIISRFKNLSAHCKVKRSKTSSSYKINFPFFLTAAHFIHVSLPWWFTVYFYLQYCFLWSLFLFLSCHSIMTFFWLACYLVFFCIMFRSLTLIWLIFPWCLLLLFPLSYPFLYFPDLFQDAKPDPLFTEYFFHLIPWFLSRLFGLGFKDEPFQDEVFMWDLKDCYTSIMLFILSNVIYAALILDKICDH